MKFRAGQHVDAIKVIAEGTRRRWCKAIVRVAIHSGRLPSRYEVEFRDGSHAVLFGDEIRKVTRWENTP